MDSLDEIQPSSNNMSLSINSVSEIEYVAHEDIKNFSECCITPIASQITCQSNGFNQTLPLKSESTDATFLVNISSQNNGFRQLISEIVDPVNGLELAYSSSSDVAEDIAVKSSSSSFDSMMVVHTPTSSLTTDSKIDDYKEGGEITGVKRTNADESSGSSENTKILKVLNHEEEKRVQAVEHSKPPEERLTVTRMLLDFDIHETIIGSGNFGTVFKAKSKVDGASYAIKKSRRPFNGKVSKKRMMNEVHALAALGGSSLYMSMIVRYYSSWVEDDYVYIQMELCDKSLDNLVKNFHPFTHDDIYAILKDMLLALKTLHRLDIAHLDVKPGNIMRKTNHANSHCSHRYCLGDFGLALQTTNGIASLNDIEEGDGRYMAKELLGWGQVDLTKCDIFSLGITAYEIAMKISLPMNGVLFHQLREGGEFSTAGLPLEMVNIFKSLMAENPADRPSAQRCLEEHLALKSDLEKELFAQRRQIEDLTLKLEETMALVMDRSSQLTAI